jgi:hypothetical protein
MNRFGSRRRDRIGRPQQLAARGAHTLVPT